MCQFKRTLQRPKSDSGVGQLQVSTVVCVCLTLKASGSDDHGPGVRSGILRTVNNVMKENVGLSVEQQKNLQS